MYKSLLSCSVLALLCTVSLAQADNAATIDQTFFNIGGPNKGVASTTSSTTTLVAPTTTVAASATAVASATTTVPEPAPVPDPALFTEVKNLSEQTSDNAVDIFGLRKRAQAASAASTLPTSGATVATANQPVEPNMPDPSLFTNTGTPKEQTRDHPFKLF